MNFVSKAQDTILITNIAGKSYAYKTASSSIKELSGSVVFSNDHVQVPPNWSQTATDILVQKYFRKTGIPVDTTIIQEEGVFASFYRKEPLDGSEELIGEHSAHQVFHRLAGCWTYWGIKSNYFKDEDEALKFYDDCYYALYHQIAAPNSPQWFNTGLNWAYGIKSDASKAPLYHFDLEQNKVVKSQFSYVNPQVHACFIQSIDDNLISKGGIMDLFIREASVFKYGSGSGTNFSKIRGLNEKLSGGGKSSGLMSFLKIGDVTAGSIKSGGTTRRAAKMLIVDIDHPEVEAFIDWKSNEENKVAALITGSKLNKKLVTAIVSAEDEDAAYEAAAEAKEFNVPDGLIQRALEANRLGYTLDLAEFDNDWQSEAYQTVSGQNGNNSISITDSFMTALKNDASWNLTARTDGSVMKTVEAKKLWESISRAAWTSADPAVQYVDTMNKWNTCSNDERIIATNPCSEYIWFDDTACNLASLNLVAIWEEADRDISKFADALAKYSRLFATVLDISIQMAQFVSEKIAEKTFEYRTTGLGYANIGSLLMRNGIAYGSNVGNLYIAAITSIMTGNAYAQSAVLAERIAPFPAFERNKKPFMNVMSMHAEEADKLYEEINGVHFSSAPRDVSANVIEDLAYLSAESSNIWIEVTNAESFRNAQTTVIAPTGTIGLVMDCDTTGIEPDFSLIKGKKLAGGGYMKLVNTAITPALETLGYGSNIVNAINDYIGGTDHFPNSHSTSPVTGEEITADELMGYITEEDLLNFGVDKEMLYNLNYSKFYDLASIINYLADNSRIDLSLLLGNDAFYNTQKFIFGYGNIDDCTLVKEEHKKIFSCAVSGKPDGMVISPNEHLTAMAAAQRFVSGAISKTINMPTSATAEDIADVYLQAHALGIKAVSIYRDKSKLSQPLTAAVSEKLVNFIKKAAPSLDVKVIEQEVKHQVNIIAAGTRRRLPNKRIGYTQKATISGHNLYIRTGNYKDGKLGEIFIDMHKEGATLRSTMNAFAIAVSIGLQYGVPLEEFFDAFHRNRFEPAGPVVGHDNIKMATSIIDFIFRDLAYNYLDREDVVEIKTPKETVTAELFESTESIVEIKQQTNSVTVKQIVKPYSSSNIYTGESCTSCGSDKMKASGTCSTCQDCGETSGCS